MSRRERLRGQAIDTLIERYPEILRAQGIPADTCVTAACAGAHALRELGFRARPVACNVFVANPAAKQMLDEGLRPGPAGSEWETVGSERGAWAVFISRDPDLEVPPDRFNGHMVIAVDEREAVDLTAHQFDRPGRGIAVPPLRFEITPAFVRGETPAAFGVNDCYLEYTATPDNTDWAGNKHYPGWGRDMIAVGRLLAGHLRKHGARDLDRGKNRA